MISLVILAATAVAAGLAGLTTGVGLALLVVGALGRTWLSEMGRRLLSRSG